MTPRGIRNHNSCNIRKGDNWIGLDIHGNDPSFCVFTAPEFGLRAAAMILLKYQKRGVDTVEKIIASWAPSVENDTEAYIKSVCKHMGVQPDQRLDLRHKVQMVPLLQAIVRHENGPPPTGSDWYPPLTYRTGAAYAGVGD